MTKMPPPLLLLLLLLLSTTVHGRLTTHSSLADVFISDGVLDHLPEQPPLDLVLRLTEESCKETYGFMPCTTTVIGNLILIVVYGCFMWLAALCISTGSELLLKILGPGIVGGLFLPVLDSFPDAMIVLVSGLSESTETAQYKVSVGMGLLAGTTITLLTIIWGSCVVAGKCALNEHSEGFCLTGYGIRTDESTRNTAQIMFISMIPFFIAQITPALPSTSGRQLAVWVSLIVSLFLLISYCLYQVYYPWIQERRIEYVILSGILEHLRERGFEKLLTDDGEINKEVLEKAFRSIDQDSDGKLSAAELRALVIGIEFDEIYLDKDDAVEKVMKEFDTSQNGFIELNEFSSGIKKWQKAAKRSRRSMFKAVLMLLLGTIISVAFANPLVDAVYNISSATSIPSFLISFIALPVATNISEWLSTIISANQKEIKYASLSLSETYGAVTMNNLLGLSVFSAIVYIRGLTWNFSAEVLVINIVCIVMWAFASFRSTFPVWTALVAFLLYPFSIGLICILNYVFGWS